ncbi:hypothetical protein Q0601_00440 [Paracoccus onubensis]|uniref:hypothetical protein n=1 Tax=Paracoccus onubensis TaxID=1675788 RepID=UPI002731FEAB|nr:hypothetical protein [Paracoccus onubensis]MDP0925631.1 hypothetical protein [Paracoccus onubensis]
MTDAMEQIAVGDGAADVAMLMGVLEAHGFDPVATDRHSGLTLSNLSQAIGGVRVFVRVGQAGEAGELLTALGMPVWSRPSWRTMLFFAFAWWFAHVPPPGLGSALVLRPGTGDETQLADP